MSDPELDKFKRVMAEKLVHDFAFTAPEAIKWKICERVEAIVSYVKNYVEKQKK
jgi:hypothetical protein